jgi:hypothetical protein
MALAVCLLCAPITQAAPEYTFHEIAIPGGIAWSAMGINDAGVIVGRHADVEYNWRAFVGVPVPEPGTAVLLLAGLGAARMFGLRRRGRCGDDARP